MGISLIGLKNNEVKQFNASHLEQIELTSLEGHTAKGKRVEKHILLEVWLNDEIIESHKISVWKANKTWIDLFEALNSRYKALSEGSVKTVESGT